MKKTNKKNKISKKIRRKSKSKNKKHRKSKKRHGGELETPFYTYDDPFATSSNYETEEEFNARVQRECPDDFIVVSRPDISDQGLRCGICQQLLLESRTPIRQLPQYQQLNAYINNEQENDVFETLDENQILRGSSIWKTPCNHHFHAACLLNTRHIILNEQLDTMNYNFQNEELSRFPCSFDLNNDGDIVRGICNKPCILEEDFKMINRYIGDHKGAFPLEKRGDEIGFLLEDEEFLPGIPTNAGYRFDKMRRENERRGMARADQESIQNTSSLFRPIYMLPSERESMPPLLRPTPRRQTRPIRLTGGKKRKKRSKKVKF